MATLTDKTKIEAEKLGVTYYNLVEYTFPFFEYDEDGYALEPYNSPTIKETIDFLNQFDNQDNTSVCFNESSIVIYKKIDKEEEDIKRLIEKRIAAIACSKQINKNLKEQKKLKAAKAVAVLEKKLEKKRKEAGLDTK